jgi:hypothetical protein
VTDRIEDIVERTIAHTRGLLATMPEIWPVARVGVQKIRDDLALDAPDHPALPRLQAFVAEIDQCAGDPARPASPPRPRR